MRDSSANSSEGRDILVKIIEESLDIVQSLDINDIEIKRIAFKEILGYMLRQKLLLPREFGGEFSGVAAELTKMPLDITYEEFIDMLSDKCKHNYERLLAVVYWLGVREEIPCVTPHLIVKRFRENPVWPLPGNVYRDLKVARKKGYLSKREIDGKICWVPTGKGRRLIEGLIEEALEEET